MSRSPFILAALLLTTTAAASASEPAPPTAAPAAPAARAASNTDALAFLDGVWIGPATFVTPTGERITMTQMERVGPMLGGEIRIMEGKARSADGQAVFNAFTVFAPTADGGISMRSHTPGHVGERVLELRPGGEGFAWEMAAGPNRIRYIASVRGGVWRETGFRIAADGTETPFFEMTLQRVGNTDWPAANPQFPTR
ncbi:MAG TPA: DUF1579 domain-containing protein [Allosphingosinicella sp.]|jgi:hypothetical protein